MQAGEQWGNLFQAVRYPIVHPMGRVREGNPLTAAHAPHTQGGDKMAHPNWEVCYPSAQPRGRGGCRPPQTAAHVPRTSMGKRGRHPNEVARYPRVHPRRGGRGELPRIVACAPHVQHTGEREEGRPKPEVDLGAPPSSTRTTGTASRTGRGVGTHTKMRNRKGHPPSRVISL